MLQQSTPNQMTTFSDCLRTAKDEGYVVDFEVGPQGISAPGLRSYSPAEINVENYYRFEGVSDPADSMILYLIRTNDDIKGTLSDGYGVYADEKKGEYMKEVEEISKKIKPNKN
jgi:hypothetical protein